MLDEKLAKSLLIFDLMENPKAMITVDTDLAEAMKNMDRFKLKHLPVNGKNGEFLGFVSRAAMFRLYRSVIRESDRD